jgi:hypothetical protein
MILEGQASVVLEWCNTDTKTVQGLEAGFG